MENVHHLNHALIERSYVELFDKVLRYINSRVNNVWDAENLTQDVWVRLLSYPRELSADTVTQFIFTVARNLVNDYLRRLCSEREWQDETVSGMESAVAPSPESEVAARDLERFELIRVECLPQQRRIIYMMSRYEEKTPADIAAELSLSFRTVENHLRLGRRDVREYIAAIA